MCISLIYNKAFFFFQKLLSSSPTSLLLYLWSLQKRHHFEIYLKQQSYFFFQHYLRTLQITCKVVRSEILCQLQINTILFFMKRNPFHTFITVHIKSNEASPEMRWWQRNCIQQNQSRMHLSQAEKGQRGYRAKARTMS